MKDQRKDLKRLSSEADLPTIVVVALGDATALDFSSLVGQRRVAEEVRLVRSALLYAGQVELVSPALFHLQKLIGLSNSGADGVIELLEMHQGEKGFDLVGRSQHEVEEVLRVTRELAAFQERYSRAQRRNNPDLREAQKVYDQYLGSGYDSIASSMRRQYVEAWRNYGGDDIDQALESGALTFGSASLFRDEATSDLNAEYLAALLTKLLQNPRSYLLLDDHIRLLAEELTQNGEVSPSDVALTNSARAGVGSRFIEHLPVFPDASMENILEARSELTDLRGRYFKGVRHVQDKIASSPLEADFLPEVDAYWRDEVHPTVAEMAKTAAQTKAAAAWEVSSKALVRFLDVPTIQEGVGALTMGLAGTALADLATGGLSALAYKYGLNVHEILKARQAKRTQDAGSEWQYLLQLTKRL
ncbi:hypothetical protein C627_06970 [Corynebacterium glutamicum ZL-6]|uniref:hypothetical protein n=1 Tax=Corynebacterium TaxID=1716 RepID=UPI00071F1CDD|nr:MULTISPECIES: hypothetical protein [Corynebacterium]ANR65365.1 hypothetical protein C627_06970 [Corynebacterium glutamicum ZL-6]PST75720.1 hypothetical protein I919_07086 [Corynebacterium glutamicum ZL-2]ALP49993.1 hypothetical protein AC079_07140 [Corynebacterium glutamicum]ANR62360.1 hypothetical protein C628_07005 [[Brevibacterium] flavum ZL-1]ANU33506.1 hypothetical protein BBD29_06935 [Corynebacterium glutamicum]